MGTSVPQTFAIMVKPAGSAPQIQTITVAEGRATLTWAAVPGTTYRLQHKAVLDQSSWNDLTGDVQATADSASKEDATLGTTTHRFYRVMVVP